MSLSHPTSDETIDHVLERLGADLTAKFAGIFSTETIERYVHESYVAPYRTATLKRYVPVLAGHFATERLTALAQAQGPSTKQSPRSCSCECACTTPDGRRWQPPSSRGRRMVASTFARQAPPPADQITPAVTEVMEEIGLGLAPEYSKPLTDDVVRAADVVITMGCGDACPVYPGKRYLDWTVGDRFNESIETVREIRDDLDARVHALLHDVLPPHS